MDVAVLGATGFVGRALVLALLRRGHAVRALARAPARAARTLPAGVEVVDFADDAALAGAIARADAVVNLAGEAIAGPRWTARRKRVLVDSRVASTERLALAIAARPRTLPPLAAFVSASASGYYGDRGDDPLPETAGPGEGFAADLCRAWEAATAAAAPRAARIVHARLGVVLGLEGGMLAALRPIYRFGLGGPIAGGRAWLPWIHLDDVARALVHLCEDDAIAGPVNLVAPEPVRQRDLAHAYGAALHRPSVVPTPRFALRMLLGEQVLVLTASQRVVPHVLETRHFAFRFPSLDAALADLAGDTQDIQIERAGELPASTYLERHRARYVLRTTTTLDAPLADVFAFFASPENLAALTPPKLAFDMVSPPEPAHAGQLIDYRIRVAHVPLTWRTQIEEWVRGRRFVDSQLRGPYRAWWHEHAFRAVDGDRTVMEDRVYYAPPLALLAQPIVAPMLRRIFAYRRQAIRLRF